MQTMPGCNCCYWDGEKITANLGSHGYLFNDEGSGADLGRTLLSALLNGEVPHDVEHLFKDWAGGKKLLDIRTEVYQAPKVNVALAEYSRFLAAHLQHPMLRYMAIARFSAFVTRHITRIHRYQELPIHFVGSVADVYAEPLGEALKLMQLVPTSITAAPGDALLQYHMQQLQDAAAQSGRHEA
jgi:glucosamine kinase